MLKNNLKIALRNLLRKKVFSIINITGLAIGMSCCLLIALYVNYELSYDKFHLNYDRMYRVLHADGREGTPSSEDYQVWGNAPVAPALKDFYSQIDTYTRFTSPVKLLFNSGEKTFQENNVIFMDSTAFRLFSWKVIAGNPDKALIEPGNIVLTRSMALKYFGHTDVLGETFIINNDEEMEAMVTAVIEDVPANSHFTFDALLSMTTFHFVRPEVFTMYDYVDFYTYFSIHEGAEITEMEPSIPAFIDKYVVNAEPGYTIKFEPFSEAYLYSEATRQPGVTGNANNLFIFISIAVFILLIACINFINLSTARSMERAKEVGVRKTVGAIRSALIKQFLMESLLLTIFAAAFSLVIAEFSLPVLRMISGKNIPQEILRSVEVLTATAGIALLVGLLAGSYPAWILSSFKPAKVLKGTFKNSIGGTGLRKALVVFQFCLSIILIAGTGVVFLQLQYLQNKDLGFQKEQMLVIDFGFDSEVIQNLQSIKNEFLMHSDVESATASRSVPGDFIPNSYARFSAPDGTTLHRTPLIYEVDFDFIPAFKLDMAAGRPFSAKFLSDSTAALIINEAMVKNLGYQNAEEAIGKEFYQWGRSGHIVGVVKDFNFLSLHKDVQPLTIRASDYLSKLSLKISSNNLSKTLTDLEKKWNQLIPHRPFLYSFLDTSLNEQYKAETRFGQIFSLFAGLAIFIACLGLFGLAAYSSEQRTKEIGIRKVLGATVINIFSLLSKDFLKLVIISTIVALPVAWYIMEAWLNEFAYKATIGVDIFIISGAVAIFIAFITISWQSIQAALSNPVKSLRSE